MKCQKLNFILGGMNLQVCVFIPMCCLCRKTGFTGTFGIFQTKCLGPGLGPCFVSSLPRAAPHASFYLFSPTNQQEGCCLMGFLVTGYGGGWRGPVAVPGELGLARPLPLLNKCRLWIQGEQGKEGPLAIRQSAANPWVSQAGALVNAQSLEKIILCWVGSCQGWTCL